MPVTINCAYTEQVNPAGATPVLTRDQIWKGLQRKIRKAEDFLPVIQKTEVIEEKDNVVTRDATFAGTGGFEAKVVREVCKSYYPTRVDFWQPDGTVIVNTVSDGPGMTENDLYLTYTFEFYFKDIEEGSKEHHDKFEERRQGAKSAVHSSIEGLRKMAKAGELD